MADSKIVQYIQKVKWDDQKAETKHLTKRAVIDAVGCALAGSAHDTVPGVINSMLEIEGRGCNTVWGTKSDLELKGAIFMNAYSVGTSRIILNRKIIDEHITFKQARAGFR